MYLKDYNIYIYSMIEMVSDDSDSENYVTNFNDKYWDIFIHNLGKFCLIIFFILLIIFILISVL